MGLWVWARWRRLKYFSRIFWFEYIANLFFDSLGYITIHCSLNFWQSETIYLGCYRIEKLGMLSPALRLAYHVLRQQFYTFLADSGRGFFLLYERAGLWGRQICRWRNKITYYLHSCPATSAVWGRPTSARPASVGTAKSGPRRTWRRTCRWSSRRRTRSSRSRPGWSCWSEPGTWRDSPCPSTRSRRPWAGCWAWSRRRSSGFVSCDRRQRSRRWRPGWRHSWARSGCKKIEMFLNANSPPKVDCALAKMLSQLLAK